MSNKVLIALTLIMVLDRREASVITNRKKRSVESYTWKNCGPENATFVLEKLELAPFPMRLPGKLHINMTSKTTKEVENIDMAVEIYQLNTWFGDWKLPCIFNIGSCLYHDVCALAQGEEDFIGEAEALIVAGGGNITCPIQPLDFKVENYEFQLPSLPPGLGLAIAGDYRIRSTLLAPNSDTVLGCFEMEMGIQEADDDYTYEIETETYHLDKDEDTKEKILEEETTVDCWIWC